MEYLSISMFDTSKQQARDLLCKSQFWPASKLRELQWKKLQSLLRHAYCTSEFYRQRFDRAGLHPVRDFHSFECLRKLPILTKSDIQRYGKQILCSDSRITGVKKNSTGGSTGEPINFHQDDHYRIWADAARIRAWRNFDGVSASAIEAVLWGADRDVGKGFSYTSLVKNILRYRTLQLNTFNITADRIRKYFRIYNVLRPSILRGYASSLYFVANFLSKEGITTFPPKVIISSAEMLKPVMRKRISENFGADIIDSYGCREVSQIATECQCHCGLHIVMENQHVEILDKQIIVTNLNNLAMPFIRYQVGDLADRIDTAPCACGREAHRLMGLKGRDNENITLPDNTIVNGEFFEFLFFDFQTVEQFQVIFLREQEQLLVRLQVTDRSENVDSMIRQKMQACFGFSNVRVEYTDRFDKTLTGKFRFVYSVDRL